MGLLREISVYLLCLSAVASAIPVSLIEDIKDAQLQAPLRTNKVKRAQEVLMFGNQQNRAVNNYGSPRPEKRDLGDNSLAEDVATLPNMLPQVEDQVYDTNQLSSGSGQVGYPYIGRGEQPNYGMLLRNAALKESLVNEPVLGYGDMPLYNMMDARRKRDAHKSSIQHTKNSFRSKRDYDLSPDELVSLMRLLENQRRQNGRFHDQRSGWPVYNQESEDTDFASENPDDNEIDTEGEGYNRNGVWMDGPVGFGQSQRDGEYWPRKYKRFMVSKRRQDLQDGLSPYDFPEGLPLQRRFIL